ncbi:MAG: hypothetical protein IPH45_09595 [Bacteroidales bacterium]|nr:hypothetical protein [Bacteroidales bacterium]
MDKTEIKGILLETCKKRLLDSISNLEIAMNDAQQQANEYGAPRDRYDAFRAQLMRKRDMMAQQLDTELNELKVLEKIDPNKRIEIVGFGALVFSQDQNYFVAISSGKIEIESQLFYAISAKVPIYQALQGKKRGESCEFRGKSIQILDIC